MQILPIGPIKLDKIGNRESDSPQSERVSINSDDFGHIRSFGHMSHNYSSNSSLSIKRESRQHLSDCDINADVPEILQPVLEKLSQKQDTNLECSLLPNVSSDEAISDEAVLKKTQDDITISESFSPCLIPEGDKSEKNSMTQPL